MSSLKKKGETATAEQSENDEVQEESKQEAAGKSAKKKLTKVITQAKAMSALTGMTMADMEGGEPVGKHTVQLMIMKAVGDATDQFTLDTKNAEAERLDFETKIRKGM